MDCLASRGCVCVCICICIGIPPVYVYVYFLQLLLTELKLKLGDEVSTRLFSFEEMQRTSVWATKASSLYFHCQVGGPKAYTVFPLFRKASTVFYWTPLFFRCQVFQPLKASTAFYCTPHSSSGQAKDIHSISMNCRTRKIGPDKC